MTEKPETTIALASNPTAANKSKTEEIAESETFDADKYQLVKNE